MPVRMAAPPARAAVLIISRRVIMVFLHRLNFGLWVKNCFQGDVRRRRAEDRRGPSSNRVEMRSIHWPRQPGLAWRPGVGTRRYTCRCIQVGFAGKRLFAREGLHRDKASLCFARLRGGREPFALRSAHQPPKRDSARGFGEEGPERGRSWLVPDRKEGWERKRLGRCATGHRF